MRSVIKIEVGNLYRDSKIDTASISIFKLQDDKLFK